MVASSQVELDDRKAGRQEASGVAQAQGPAEKKRIPKKLTLPNCMGSNAIVIPIPRSISTVSEARPPI